MAEPQRSIIGESLLSKDKSDNSGASQDENDICQDTINPLRNILFKTLGVTVLAFILSFVLVAPFSSSLSVLFSSPDKNDFSMSDLFAQVADERPVRDYQTDIVIVDIARADRDDIAEILETLSFCGVKKIALDVNFEVPHEDDSRLISAIEMNPGIILPVGLDKAGTNIAYKPFFYDSIQNGVEYAVVNLIGKSQKSTIREMQPFFKLNDGRILKSFPVATVGDNTKLTKDSRISDNLLTIDYPSKEFMIYDWHDIIDHAEDFADKYVLVGALTDATDMHATPINSYMAGLLIHAYSVATLLNNVEYTHVNDWVDYLLSFIVCFILLFLAIRMTANIKALLLRVIQVILLYCTVRIGYTLYVDHHVISDFSYLLLMIAFGLFALDIWNGAEFLIDKCREKLSKMNENKSSGMRNVITLLLLVIMANVAMAQHYSIHSFTDGVKLESAGKTLAVTKGMNVKATDCLLIPQGGEVQIYNSLDKRIYKSLRPGKVSITKLLIEARDVAADNSKNVASRLNMGKTGKTSNKNVYVEKGMVTRSLAKYDPSAGGKEIDTKTLASALAFSIKSQNSNLDTVPLIFTHQHVGEDGLKFDLHNTLDFPVYFNIIRALETANGYSVEISPLGQPDGTYVLLPKQTISRSQLIGLPAIESHYIIMTTCKFDINELLDETEKALLLSNTSDSSLPFFIKKL